MCIRDRPHRLTEGSVILIVFSDNRTETCFRSKFTINTGNRDFTVYVHSTQAFESIHRGRLLEHLLSKKCRGGIVSRKRVATTAINLET